MNEICLIRSGTTPAIRDENLKSGVILLKTNDIRNNVLTNSNLESFFYIDEKTDEAMKYTRLQAEDVLINIVGATTDVIGRAAIVAKDFPTANITQAMAFLRIIDNQFNPYFLFSFLCGKFGNKQVRRIARPTGQYNLNLQEVSSFKVPVVTPTFQTQIENVVKAAHGKLEQSKRLYAEAESLLLNELGLRDWQPTEENTAVKSFKESFLASGRLDAEFYQPHFQRALAIISQSGMCISDVADLVKDKFETSGLKSFHYIEIGNLSNDGLARSEEIFIEDTPSRAQWVVKPKDVITSTVRPIRRLSALIETEQSNFVCSSGFAVLRPKFVEPELLLVYLRAPIICEILDLFTTASMYPAISVEDLLKIPISLPSDDANKRIVQKIRQSRADIKESKRLLETAKRGVEIAIERDEQAALEWIDDKTHLLR